MAEKKIKTRPHFIVVIPLHFEQYLEFVEETVEITVLVNVSILCSLFNIKIIFTTPALESLKHSQIAVINNTILMKTTIFPKGFCNAEQFNM